MSEQNGIINDNKLSCFKSFFLSLDMNIEELRLEKQSYPVKRWKTIVNFICSKEKEVDLKQNSIYNILESVLEKSEPLIDAQEQDRVKDIILNIASSLYDKKFKESKKESESFIIETIKWSNNTELIDKLSLFTCFYLNTSSKVCTLISEMALTDNNKLKQFYVNNRLLSKKFIDELNEFEYEQIINILLTSKKKIPLLNEDFYKNIRNFCVFDFEFFLILFQYTPFFLGSIESILEVFTLEQLREMSLEEIRFLCYFRDKKSLIKIKILMDLNVPLNEIEKVLENASVFELITLGLPISKIDKVIQYPDLVTFIYQKIATLKYSKTPLYSEYKALLKTN